MSKDFVDEQREIDAIRNDFGVILNFGQKCEEELGPGMILLKLVQGKPEIEGATWLTLDRLKRLAPVACPANANAARLAKARMAVGFAYPHRLVRYELAFNVAMSQYSVPLAEDSPSLSLWGDPFVIVDRLEVNELGPIPKPPINDVPAEHDLFNDL